jgi:hypothetical protein
MCGTRDFQLPRCRVMSNLPLRAYTKIAANKEEIGIVHCYRDWLGAGAGVRDCVGFS